ncbi:MAG: cytochrome c oxidase assembly protein [Nocardiaceae bacterium]|nr:cytochrome c oxidase assembly protein [Nocardiaceae bacterium]
MNSDQGSLMWTLAPVPLAAVVLASTGYFVLAMRSTQWSVVRVASWFGAMAALAIALFSPLAMYAHQRFWAHMLVHLILIMVAPSMLVWAQPLRLVHDRSTRAGVVLDRARSSLVFRAVVSPRFTAPLYAAVIVLTHLTGFQEAMFHHTWIHNAELVLYLASGYLLMLPLLGGELAGTREMSYPTRFAVMAMCMMPDTIVGITLMMSYSPVAPGYGAGELGTDLIGGQALAGAIMWFGGDGLMMVLMVIVAGQWVRSGGRSRGFGPWLEGVRQRTLLDRDDVGEGFDDEQDALDAYNARLAELARQANPTRPKPAAHRPTDQLTKSPSIDRLNVEG